MALSLVQVPLSFNAPVPARVNARSNVRMETVRTTCSKVVPVWFGLGSTPAAGKHAATNRGYTEAAGLGAEPAWRPGRRAAAHATYGNPTSLNRASFLHALR